MVVKRKRYEYKLYVNHKNNELWKVIDGCRQESIIPSDFIASAAIEKWKARTIIEKRHEPEPQTPPIRKHKLPPVTLFNEEAEETSMLLAQGWEIVGYD